MENDLDLVITRILHRPFSVVWDVRRFRKGFYVSPGEDVFKSLKLHSFWFYVCCWIFDVSGHGRSVNALNNIYDDDDKMLKQKKTEKRNPTANMEHTETKRRLLSKNRTEEKTHPLALNNAERSKMLNCSFLPFLLCRNEKKKKMEETTDGYNKCTH